MERFFKPCHVAPRSCEMKIPSRPPSHTPPESSTPIAAPCVNVSGSCTGSHLFPPSQESIANLKVAASTHHFADAQKLPSSFPPPHIHFPPPPHLPAPPRRVPPTPSPFPPLSPPPRQPPPLSLTNTPPHALSFTTPT